MQRVVVSVTNDLVTDQRVHKVCNTLIGMGFGIYLIGRKLSDSLPIERNYETFRMKLLFNKGFMFYAEYNIRLFFKLLFLKKDVLLSNDLDTLLPNFLISKIFSKKLVYDSHELFTEVPELTDRPRIKNTWLSIERLILPKLKNCYTVSDTIAEYYKDVYRTDFKVIKNLPYKHHFQKDRFPFDTRNKKIIIYQGAVNISRGIDLMIETMNYLDDVLFVVVGNGDVLEDLKLQTTNQKLDKKVKFLGRITPDELHRLTPLADIGISLEEDLGLNYRYSLPNKLFDYIQARVPVLVSNLPETSLVVKEFNVGEIMLIRSPKIVANQIANMLKKGKNYWKSSLEKAAEELVWENESVKLQNIFKNLR